jgi:mono/diheme cytochrome c family protein
MRAPFIAASAASTASAALLASALALALAGAARAEDAPPPLSDGSRFGPRDGAQLFHAICQGCHMPDGQGAKGAGMYPALANNPRLAGAAYPIHTVLHGRKGMPPFEDMLDDEQVAAVVTYVRTHLGNHETAPVTAAEVKALR